MNIPLDEVLYFDAITSDATGAVTDADSTPTWSIFEEATDTPILENQNFTKRTSLTGNYRGTATLSAANGFEVGKWYAVIATGIVDTITGKAVVKQFRVVPAESSAGVSKVDVTHFGGTAGTFAGGRPDVNVTHFGGTDGVFSLGLPAVNVTRWASSINVGVNGDMDLPVVSVAEISVDAITNDSVSAGAVLKIADGVWDEDATGHQTQGTFGQVIGDSGSTAASIWTNSQAILADTGTDGVVVATASKTGYALSATGLDAISVADPGGVASMTTLPKMIVAVWRRLFKKVTQTTSELKTYADNGTDVNTTEALSESGGTQTKGAAS